MIKTAGELIAKAQTMISCLNVSSAKTLYEGSKNIIFEPYRPFKDDIGLRFVEQELL